MEQRKRRNLILIGFMGCGKTSVGILLSYRLRRTFLDTDKRIEKMQGRTISTIFAQEGEAAFRQMETDCLKSLLSETEGQIFSTGGGTPVREENRTLLRQLGTVVYLKVSPDTVYERLKEDTKRPLLQTENPKVRIEELLTARQSYYEAAADVILEADDKSLGEVVEELAQLVLQQEEREDGR